MEKNERKRPGEHAPKERPRTPASGPKAPRTRTGNASAREAARRERMEHSAEARGQQSRDAVRRQPDRRGPEPVREKPEPKHREPKAKEEAAHRETPQTEQAHAPKRKKKKPHRVYNTNFGFKFAVMLAVVAAIVLSMIIFFKVKHIEVLLPTGEDGSVKSYYSVEDVAEASGINLDENLLSLSKATVASRIHAALPYVNEIQIKKQLPGTVIITISEFEITYGVQDETGGWWLMSREGRILESTDERSARNHLTVTGMPIQVPQPGDWFKPAATEGADMSEIANKQKVVLELLPVLEKAPFAKEIVSVDVSTSYDLTLWYGTRYEIRLGTTENLDYKLQFLQSTLENSDIQRKSGTIDLTFNEDNKVHFLEFR